MAETNSEAASPAITKFLTPSLAALLGITSGVLYFLTLARDVYLEDSGELIAAAYNLGIAHPSGYPLYLLLGKAFTWLPFGTVAFRLNLMSAVFAVGTAVLLFLSLLKLARILGKAGWSVSIVAFLVTLLFAVGRDFWSQAIIAEVYTLHTFLVGLLTWGFLAWWEGRKLRQVYWLAFLSGLGLTNHELFAFVLPVLWFIILMKAGEARSAKRIFVIAGLFLLGLSIYLYLPWRAAANPVVNFGQIHTFTDTVGHVLRVAYDDLNPGFANRWGHWNGFFASFTNNYSWAMVILAVGGAISLFRRRMEFLSVFGGGMILTIALIIFLRRAAYGYTTEFPYRVYYFSAYYYLFCLAFVFLIETPKAAKFFAPLLLVYVAVLGFENFQKVDLHENPVATYYEEKLLSFPRDAVYLFVSEGYDGDSELFVLLYLQKVKGLRPDVTILDDNGIFYLPEDRVFLPQIVSLKAQRQDWLRFAIQHYSRTRPLLASFPVEAYAEGLVSVPNGFALQIFPEGPLRQASPLELMPPKLPELPRGNWDRAFQDFLAAQYYQQALYFQSRGASDAATSALLSAIRFDNEVYAEDYQAFQKFRASLTAKVD